MEWLHTCSVVCVREEVGSQVSGVQHVRVEALQQRLTAAGGGDAARTALNAEVLQHEVLHNITHSLLVHPAHGTASLPGPSS